MHGFRDACMHEMHEMYVCQPAICALAVANMARTVKMGWLPGARMGVSAARALDMAVVNPWAWPLRARAPADRYFTEFGHEKRQNAVKMRSRPVLSIGSS